MKFALILVLTALGLPALGDDVRIPERYADAARATDQIDVTGTNDLGGAVNFTIHDTKAIRQFVGYLTSDRYTAVVKSLKPQFKSMSAYQVRLSSRGTPLLELRVIADSILDIPAETSFYMESDQYSENLMAPLLRLR